MGGKSVALKEATETSEGEQQSCSKGTDTSEQNAQIAHSDSTYLY